MSVLCIIRVNNLHNMFSHLSDFYLEKVLTVEGEIVMCVQSVCTRMS